MLAEPPTPDLINLEAKISGSLQRSKINRSLIVTNIEHFLAILNEIG
jgi:hypothetical protein